MTSVLEAIEILSGPLGSTVLSKDGLFRYSLTRECNLSGFTLGLTMLNPSKATHELGDTTVAKSIGFGRRLGAARLVIVNLFAFRTKDPRNLLRAADPVGPANDHFLREALGSCDRMLVAWGEFPKELAARAGPSLRLLRESGKQIHHLGTTLSGAPRHPSRLGYKKGLEALGVWN